MSGSSLFVGGSFTRYQSAAANVFRVIKISTADSGLEPLFGATTAGFSGDVVSLFQDGSAIYAGGDFTLYRGTSRWRVLKFNESDGAIDSSFGLDNSGSTATVRVIKQHDADSLLLGASY